MANHIVNKLTENWLFTFLGSYTTLDKSMLESVLYSDEPKKVSLPSLIDDDVLDDLYDDADRISSQVYNVDFYFLSESCFYWYLDRNLNFST